MRQIKLASNLSLKLQTIAHAMAILAVRGAGKTYTMLKLVEQVYQAGVQVCVVDPVGVCWGLRASADGKGPGLPIVILGGEHGDIPLESTGGEEVAQFIVETRQSVVLDLSPFRKGEMRRFMMDFGETLYRLKHREQYRDPLLMALDEADEFAPQKPQKGMERLLGAMEDIVRRGRFRGLFPVMVTQRSAVLNKDVFNQCEILIAQRTMGSSDIDAWNDWMKKQSGTQEQRDQLLGEVARLPTGTAYIWAPVLHLFKKVIIGGRETFDSSATPEIGVRRVQPKVLAPVDLEQLQERMKATIQRAKAENPVALRVELARMQAELARARLRGAAPATVPPAKAPVVVRTAERLVHVPIISAADRRRLDRLFTKVDRAGKAIATLTRQVAVQLEQLDKAGAPLVETGGAIRDLVQSVSKKIPAPRAPGQLVQQPVAVASQQETVGRSGPDAGAPKGGRRPGGARPPAAAAMPAGMPADGLKAGARRMLAVIAARHPTPLTRAQVSTLAKISKGGGTFTTYLGALRDRGLITEDNAGIAATSGGIHAAGDQMEGTALAAHWAKSLKRGARKMLEVLARWHPIPLTRNQMATLAEISARGGTFTTYLGTLRDNVLITEDSTGLRITPDGLMVSGIMPQPPRDMKEVVAVYGEVLKRGERQMLDVLLHAGRSGLTRAELSDRAGVASTGGTFTTYLGRLRDNLLIEEDTGTVRISEATIARAGVLVS